MGYISFFENFVQIVVLLFAWIVVLLAFFILAIQLFVTLIEFKLTTLAGFVLIPFGLFGKTAFVAERVLGNVISSGIKVLVLAVIVGIGSTLFSQFTAGFGGNQPTIDDAMALVLAALSLLGLGIFGPGIANGLVSGGPQLGAGAAVGTGLAAGGGVVAAGLAGAGMAVADLPRPVAWPPEPRAAVRRSPAAQRRLIAPAVLRCRDDRRSRKGLTPSMSPLRRAAGSLRAASKAGGQAATGAGSSAAAAAAHIGRDRLPQFAARLGAPHEARANHQPWRLRRRPCRSLRRSRRRRRVCRSLRRGIA